MADLTAMLEGLRSDVRAFARFRNRAQRVAAHPEGLSEELAQQVVAEAEQRALESLSSIMQQLPAVEQRLGEARAHRVRLAQRRVDLEYELDGVALRSSIGSVGDADAAEEVERARAELDAVEDELLAVEADTAALRSALDAWYDVGGHEAATM